MENLKLDIVIPIVKVDIPTFRRNILYLKQNLPVKKIVLIGASDISSEIEDITDVHFIDEDNVYLQMTLSEVKKIKKQLCGSDRRSGWYFQQFLKMAYAFLCEDKYYLIWDSDTIPIRNIEFFSDEGKPYLAYREYVPFDECFFRTQNKLLPNEALKKKMPNSFITEHLLVNVDVMKSLINDLTYNSVNRSAGTFYGNILHTIERRDINLSGFSEFEAYAAYVLKYYPELYELRYWKNLRNGKIFIGGNPSKENINWVGTYFDVLSIEDFDKQWLISKIVIFINKFIPVKFNSFYTIMKPCIFYWFKFRHSIRNNFLK